MPFKIVGKTDKGRRRSRNEDAYLIMESIGLCSVADGMGGHYGGNIASSIAVQILSEIFTQTYNPNGNEQELLTFLKETISKGNMEIYERNKQDMFPSGMGTTVVALLLKEPKVFLGFVGDSRIYLYRDKKLAQVSEDHSLVAELIRNGIISKNEAMYHQNKNIITRALGMNEDLQVDGKILDLQEGDVFLLCSDGLSDLIPEVEMENILERYVQDLEGAVNYMVDQANNAGGFDNITVVLALYSKNLPPSTSLGPRSSILIDEETTTIDLATLQEVAQDMKLSLHPNTGKTPSELTPPAFPEVPKDSSTFNSSAPDSLPPKEK